MVGDHPTLVAIVATASLLKCLEFLLVSTFKGA